MNSILTPKTLCGCNDRFSSEPYLKIENHLKELNTEIAKAEARFNLGIPDEWNLKWGNITGFIEEQTDILEYLDKYLEDNKNTLSELFENLSIQLNDLIKEQISKVEESREELNELISSFESFKSELVLYVETLVKNKLDVNVFNEFVETSQTLLQTALNLKVDKSNLPDIKNPLNHPYSTLEDSTITSVKDALDRLLYTPLQISSFTVNPTEAEVGETISKVTYNWTYNKFITSLKFDNVSISKDLRLLILELNITSNLSKTLSATDGTNTVTKTVTLTFKTGKYYGVSSTVPTSQTIISSFTRNLNLAKGSSFTVNAGSGQYIYLLVPESMSNISFMVNGFEGGFQVINNNFQFSKNGVTTKCILFRSDNPNLGNTTVTIK